VAAGDIRAAMVRGKFLLTRDALSEEMHGFGVAKTVVKTEADPDDIEARILRKLGAQ
jgi:hypothetical protein